MQFVREAAYRCTSAALVVMQAALVLGCTGAIGGGGEARPSGEDGKASGSAGSGGPQGNGGNQSGDCAKTPAAAFADAVPALTICVACHKPSGIAEGSGFVIKELTLDAVSQAFGARFDANNPDNSLLLKKSRAQVMHEGGQVLIPGTTEDVGFVNFLRALADPMGQTQKGCVQKEDPDNAIPGSTPPPPPLSLPETGVILMDPGLYRNVVEQITTRYGELDVSDLPSPMRVHFLSSNSSTHHVHDVAHLETLYMLSAKVAADSDMVKVFACGAQDLATCVRKGLPNRLETLFRKKVPDATVARFQAHFETVNAAEGADLAARAVFHEVLFSPLFLYRLEQGDKDLRLSSHELGERLALTFGRSVPDDRMTSSMRDGSFTLSSPTFTSSFQTFVGWDRPKDFIRSFFREWLGVSEVTFQTKTAAALGTISPASAPDAIAEFDGTISFHLFQKKRGVKSLFTTSEMVISDKLAPLYGLAPVGQPLAPRTLPSDDRKGLLTLSVVFAAHSKAEGVSPMQRGRLITENLMCQDYPAAAGDAVMALPPDPSGKKTLREKFAALEGAPSCSGCHRMLNAGFVFERYDALGRLLPVGQLAPGDTQAQFLSAGGTPLPATGGTDFVGKLAEHPQFVDCFSSQIVRHYLQREVKAADRALISKVGELYLADAGIFDIIETIVRTDSFAKASTGGAP